MARPTLVLSVDLFSAETSKNVSCPGNQVANAGPSGGT